MENFLYITDSTRRLSDLAGLEPIKDALYWLVKLPSEKPQLFVKAHAPPRGLLMFGPPGCGKSLTVSVTAYYLLLSFFMPYLQVKCLANEIGISLFLAGSDKLDSKWYGESSKIVASLFRVARRRAQETGYLSVIFIDTIYAFIPVSF